MRDQLQIWRLRLARTGKFLWGTALFATMAAVLCAHFDIFEMQKEERDAFDDGITILTEWTKPPQRSDDVVIVAIDDLTLQAVAKNPGYAMTFGSWPYARNVWARVFEHLANQGARAIVFDAVMDEPHPDPSGDVAMGEVVADLKVPVFLGFNVSPTASPLPKVEARNRRLADRPVQDEAEPSEEDPFDDDGPENESFDDFDDAPGDFDGAPAEAYPAARPEDAAVALAFPVKTTDLTLAKLEEDNRKRYPIPPIGPLVTSVSGFGLVVTEDDDDGRIRRTRFAYQDGVNTYVTLSVAAVADLFGADRVEVSPGELKIGDKKIAINQGGDAEIDYGGKLEERFRTISLIHVLDDWLAAEEEKPKRKIDRKVFDGKVVVIGGFALGTADVKATPFSPHTPGVVKQAAELQNLLDGRFIVEAPFWVSVLLTFLIGAFSIAIVLVFQSVLLEVAYPLVVFYGFFLVTGVFLVHGHIHVLSAMPAWAAAFCGAVGAVYNHVFVSEERERLREAFSGNVKRVLLDTLVEQKTLPRLDGEIREVTLVMTDINDFGRLAARFEAQPERLARLLNQYLTVVTEILIDHGGYVNKYLGDTVQCMFGAPLDQPDHAIRACRAALAVTEAVKRMDFDQDALETFHTRLGVTTCTAFVGNFGSAQLVDYTAVGQVMQQAAAVMRANESLGTRILVNESCVQAAGESIHVREVSLPEPSGKTPASLYVLEGMKT